MSADDYIMVRQYEGRWYATRHLASCELPPPSIEQMLADTPENYELRSYFGELDALRWATDQEAEYGVARDDASLQRVMAEKAADRQAMVDLVKEIDQRYERHPGQPHEIDIPVSDRPPSRPPV